MTNIVRRAVLALIVGLLAACGGGGDPGNVASTPPPEAVPPEPPVYVPPPTVESFPVAAVLRQLAQGYTFTGFALAPETGLPNKLSSVTYTPTGPGTFERRQVKVQGADRSEITWRAGFIEGDPGSGLRFTEFRYPLSPQTPLTNVHNLPERAVPEPPDDGVLRFPAEQLLFHNTTDRRPFSYSPEQWDHYWRLFRRSETRADLCLEMRHVSGDFFFFFEGHRDCFEIDAAGQIQKARIIEQSACCRLPTITTTYE